MSNKIKVQVSIEGRWRAGGVVEMTREQYEMLGARLDTRPRGYERERLSWEIMDACRIELRDGDVDDLEIEDFIEVGVEV